jgi:hypothetical protein
MRVGQLARKLGISPTELINFLTSAGIQTQEASNTKLSGDHLQAAIKHFDPTGKLEASLQEENKQEESKQEPNTAEEIKAEIVAAGEPLYAVQESKVEEEPVEPVSVVEEIPDAEEGSDNKIDVIKAPKVELAGLKVLGKIELPEKKKKEPPIVENTTDDATVSTTEQQPVLPRRSPRDRNPRHQATRNNREASRKNPIALKREQEAADAERKREEQAKLEKERRTQHYLSKVKSVPTKPARLIGEDVVELRADQSKTPTTWLGKLWKWFRS